MNPDGTPDINDITKAGEAATGFVGALNKLLPGISLASLHRAERRGTKLEMKDIETIVESGKRLGLPQNLVDDLIRGAMARHRRTANLEGVMSFAEQDIEDTANVADVDDEWLEHFQDYAEKVSDENMQVIWGKVLSGEMNKPGTYSKRLLSVLSQMSKTEAQTFLVLCSYMVEHLNVTDRGLTHGNANLVVMVDDGNQETYNDGAFDISMRSILESIGLIDSTISNVLNLPPAASAVFKVDDSVITVRNDSDQKKEFRFSPVLTPLGEELAKVCNSECASGIDEIFRNHAEKQGIIVA